MTGSEVSVRGPGARLVTVIPYGTCECGCGLPTPITSKSWKGNGDVKGQPRRFITGHNGRNSGVGWPAAFWARVDKNAANGCWQWLGPLLPTGYGQCKAEGEKLIHRVSWVMFYGPIPGGLQVDHLCRNRGCVNPDHMELVTLGENVLRGVGLSAQNARKTHCHRGHPLSGENLHITPKGTRRCRTCLREWAREKRAA